MNYLSIIICGIMISSSIPCFSSENKTTEIIANQNKTNESVFDSCGKDKGKGCSKQNKKRIKNKTYKIKKQSKKDHVN